MKNINKTLVTFTLALAGSALFYKQTMGINFLIFTLISVIVLYNYNKVSSYSDFLKATLPTILCSIILMIYPQDLTYLTWLFCYLIMWVHVKKIFKPLLIPLQAIISIIVAPLYNKTVA